MGTVQDYFNIDQRHNISIQSVGELGGTGGPNILAHIHQDFGSGAVYVVFYVPPVVNPLSFCMNLIQHNAAHVELEHAPKFTTVSQMYPCPVPSSTLQFCGRIYFYSENSLTAAEIESLREFGEKHSLFIQYFGPEWARWRSTAERPRGFISHDSRDSELIARPLALKLAGRGVPVWFDEFQLKIGDSLRESIERGLKECHKCVLVLTPNFLSNQGWTKVEFNSVFTREILEQKQLVLPVWAGVGRREVYEYCPSLADKVAANWSAGPDDVASRIAAAIDAEAIR